MSSHLSDESHRWIAPEMSVKQNSILPLDGWCARFSLAFLSRLSSLPFGQEECVVCDDGDLEGTEH